MQKKRNIKSRVIDIAIIILCVTGSTVSAITFWQVYNRTLSKLNEEPVGIVIFKQRTAQRRFADRFVWDMLRQSSPLYNGDTIRTIELSEAVIALKDEETKLTIFENTMIKIFFNDKEGATVDFSAGNLEVTSGTASVTVTSGTSVITVEGQADFVMSDEGLSFSVLEGSVNIDGERIEKPAIIEDSVAAETETIPAETEEKILTPEEAAQNLVRRGWEYLETRDLDRAMADFNECIRLNPNIAGAHAGIANVYLIKGDNRAVESLENAVRLEPNNSQYRELLEIARSRRNSE